MGGVVQTFKKKQFACEVSEKVGKGQRIVRRESFIVGYAGWVGFENI